MNREIKFEFLYKGNSSIWHKKHYSLNQLINTPLSRLSDVHGISELVAKRQFTGLKDKDGVEIYEGDIVARRDLDKHSDEYHDWIECIEGAEHENVPVILQDFDVVTMGRFPTYWLEKEAFGYEGEDLQHNEDYEVIGNIHQNPELLEASNG